jgi:hypothetical protein
MSFVASGALIVGILLVVMMKRRKWCHGERRNIRINNNNSGLDGQTS